MRWLVGHGRFEGVRALAHAKVPDADKARLRDMRAGADPVLLLAAMRAAQAELGKRVDKRGMELAAVTPRCRCIRRKPVVRAVDAGRGA